MTERRRIKPARKHIGLDLLPDELAALDAEVAARGGKKWNPRGVSRASIIGEALRAHLGLVKEADPRKPATLEEHRRAVVVAAYLRAGRCVHRAAAALGVNRKTLGIWLMEVRALGMVPGEDEDT